MKLKLVQLFLVLALLSGGIVGVGVSAASAAACYGQTDQPHYSGHVPGNVNVLSRTGNCGGWVYVHTDLYRQRWYGWQLLSSNQATGINYVQISTNWTCAGSGTFTYLANSTHTAQNHGPLYTSNTGRFNC